jgi:hypothetical protein
MILLLVIVYKVATVCCKINIIDCAFFVKVGGGTAGCIVASRLASQFSVLLVELGGNPVPSVTRARPYGVWDHPAINTEFTSLPNPWFEPYTNGVSFLNKIWRH